jgi:hypothetical protein
MTTPCRISSAASSDERASPPGCLRRLPGTKLNSPSRLGAGSRIHANPALCVGGCEAQCLLDGSNREPHFAPLGAADGLHGSALSPRLRARLLDAQSRSGRGRSDKPTKRTTSPGSHRPKRVRGPRVRAGGLSTGQAGSPCRRGLGTGSLPSSKSAGPRLRLPCHAR